MGSMRTFATNGQTSLVSSEPSVSKAGPKIRASLNRRFTIANVIFSQYTLCYKAQKVTLKIYCDII